jgi:hypothetical protein
LTFVAADGSIYGMGSRLQGSENEDELYKKIPIPAECELSNIKKVHIEKFARLIWTKDGRFFHNG